MANIPLKDILISARQESYRMRHFYLGVEHILIALLEVKGGIAAGILKQEGLTSEYVIDAIRRKIGKGSQHRLWAGVPNTPRTDVVLGIANEIALEEGRKEIEERDLLIAIFEERDSIAVRALEALNLDIDVLTQAARTYQTSAARNTQPFVQVDFGPGFDPDTILNTDQLFVLRRMFHGYASIRLERRLMGGYTPSLILVVTPINADTREDAAVVVKIGETDAILDEAQRYDSYVRGRLPPFTARLEERPTAPETSDLAGVKYTLVASPDTQPQDLRAVAKTWSGEALAQWIETALYPTFGKMWWRQNRLYRFQVWREYDWLLPPVLTLELLEKPPGENAHILKFPIRRMRLGEIEYGDLVVVQNFTVQKIDRDQKTIQLALGNSLDTTRAYKIEVRGIDFEKDTYYRGEVVEQLAGSVWKTRDEQLLHAVRALEPDFALDADSIPLNESTIENIPNPLSAYHAMLDSYVNGTLSTIHGDMHLGNILVGPNNSPSLIDFEHTRDGHTVFDWATLEISLLNELVMPVAGTTWDDARRVLCYIAPLTVGDPLPDDDPAMVDAMQPIIKVRGIARECLNEQESWGEYFIALAACALRAIRWENLPRENRRLMFLLAGLAMYELRHRVQQSGEAGTPSPEETDLNKGLDD